MKQEDVVARLREEIALVSNRRSEDIKAELSLADNGINSLGFVELLLAVEQDFGVKLMDSALTSEELSSLEALAKKIIQLLENR